MKLQSIKRIAVCVLCAACLVTGAVVCGLQKPSKPEPKATLKYVNGECYLEITEIESVWHLSDTSYLVKSSIDFSSVDEFYTAVKTCEFSSWDLGVMNTFWEKDENRFPVCDPDQLQVFTGPENITMSPYVWWEGRTYGYRYCSVYPPDLYEELFQKRYTEYFFQGISQGNCLSLSMVSLKFEGIPSTEYYYDTSVCSYRRVEFTLADENHRTVYVALTYIIGLRDSSYSSSVTVSTSIPHQIEIFCPEEGTWINYYADYGAVIPTVDWLLSFRLESYVPPAEVKAEVDRILAEKAAAENGKAS